MIYGSVCSGIEAASVAWNVLGWKPSFFSEIEKFPCQVLAHHYGSNLPGEKYSRNGTPNYGDMTNYKDWPDHAIDILIGGTPCQDFSIAGLRAGLDGERGNLSLVYAAIARKYRPRWLVWENVPGVLSSNGGRDFASILGLLAGRKINPPADGWKNAGYIDGYKNAYGLAWRVLDAQACRVDGFERAVPQRRRRVFIVGYSGNWQPAAAVLFERESMSGNIAPSRKTREEVAKNFVNGARRGDYEYFALQGTLVGRNAGGPCGVGVSSDGSMYTLTKTDVHCVATAQGGETIVSAPVASTLDASYGTKYGQDNQHVNAGCPLFVCTLGHSQSNGLGVQQDNLANTLEATSSANQAVADKTAIRRLTPRECERLMGFPDDYTNINETTADGSRYKALGNSMAVNVMRWIGRRIEKVEAIINQNKEEAA